MSSSHSSVVCNCPGPDKHRLGGIFTYGDTVLVHFDDDVTETGTVLTTLKQEGKALVMLGDRTYLTIDTDKLWLASP